VPRSQARGPRRRRWSLRTAVVATMALSAAPAAAAVLMQNYVKVDVNRVAACMTKVGGSDSTTFNNAANAPYIGVNTTNTLTTAAGVSLLNETVTLKAFKGDRTSITDGFRVRNTCNYPLTISLLAEAQPDGSAALTGDWTDVAMSVYLAKPVITPVGAVPTAGLSFTTVADWDQAPIKVTPSAAGALANAQTGTVTLAANGELQIGYLIDAGTTASTTTASTLRFTVRGQA
jgi:hypothetical protein